MTKKINLYFMLVIAVSILLSVSFTTAVSYQLFQKEVFSDLASFARLMNDLDFLEQMKRRDFAKPENELRITWVQADGSVLYDSYTKNSVMENHADRPEILQAMEHGEGTSIRKSKTTGQNIFFYATCSDNGTIIRIAKEAESIFSIFRNTLPATLLLAFFSFFVSLLIARHLTRAFLKPIARLAGDMGHLEEADTYKELVPILDRIRSRHNETLKNMKLRQEFTANVSHELKTPLTSISGYSELIANGMASKKEGRRFAAEIHDNAQRLLTLINDILQLSELDDAPKQNLPMSRVDVYEAARHCMTLLRPSADRQDVSLSLQGTSLFVNGSMDLLEELIYNLCDNAIRYNKKGGHVWLTVSDQLIVRDDGIGIPKKCQKQVFERFFRVDKSRSKKTGGTGLGLAIVKHIVEVHGAELSLDSDEGIGTTVHVRFPESSTM